MKDITPTEALTEVMLWISNWGPAFLEDDEWPLTEANVQHALKNAGATPEQLRKVQTYAFDEAVEPGG